MGGHHWRPHSHGLGHVQQWLFRSARVLECLGADWSVTCAHCIANTSVSASSLLLPPLCFGIFSAVVPLVAPFLRVHDRRHLELNRSMGQSWHSYAIAAIEHRSLTLHNYFDSFARWSSRFQFSCLVVREVTKPGLLPLAACSFAKVHHFKWHLSRVVSCESSAQHGHRSPCGDWLLLQVTFALFKEIAAVFQPHHAAEVILNVNASDIARRIQGQTLERFGKIQSSIGRVTPTKTMIRSCFLESKAASFNTYRPNTSHVVVATPWKSFLGEICTIQSSRNFIRQGKQEEKPS
eukprot:979271-Amphidinium_carterae.1